jgi:predicted metal-dependent phosphotriesterase family hydrolase
MKPADRYAWIADYLSARSTPSTPHSVDILDAAFVDAYTVATGAKSIVHFYGADTCKQLGRDLSKMHALGKLTRCRVGISAGYSGMPKWVWSYQAPKS